MSSEAEQAINRQINAELQAAHQYLGIMAYFGRDSVALPGLRQYFKRQYEDERQHAQQFIDYQNTRGGQVQLAAVREPQLQDWKSARNAVEVALEMERAINVSLLHVHQVAEESQDPQLQDFIENGFLEEQIRSIKELADMLTQLQRVGNDGLGLFLFDKDLAASDGGGGGKSY